MSTNTVKKQNTNKNFNSNELDNLTQSTQIKDSSNPLKDCLNLISNINTNKNLTKELQEKNTSLFKELENKLINYKFISKTLNVKQFDDFINSLKEKNPSVKKLGRFSIITRTVAAMDNSDFESYNKGDSTIDAIYNSKVKISKQDKISNKEKQESQKEALSLGLKKLHDKGLNTDIKDISDIKDLNLYNSCLMHGLTKLEQLKQEQFRQANKESILNNFVSLTLTDKKEILFSLVKTYNQERKQ